MASDDFFLRIWGARGSLPAPALGNTEFGSDTSCVEVRCGGRILIFDAGSGIASLGLKLAEEGATEIDLFFSHCHHDHMVGLPFLKPLYSSATRIRIHAGHFLDGMTCQGMLDGFMAAPYFPLTPKFFRAAIEHVDFRPPQTLTPHEGVSVRTVRLNHPNGAVGYRVDYGGRSICYMTDNEHVPGQLDPALVETIRGADIMVYDCTFTETEFRACLGYGHSTWEHGIALCEAAGVKRLVLFHHRPGRDDASLRDLEAEAQTRFPGAVVARTGLELSP